MEKPKNKIGIIGYGYVGKAMAKLFQEWGNFDVFIYDKFIKEYQNKEKVNKCDLAIICVPTPIAGDKSCNISIVEDVISWLETPLILIKSAVIPGTADFLIKKYKKRIAVSPEYIGEGKYYVSEWKYPHPTEVVKHSFMIVGGNKKDTEEVINIFQKAMGPEKRYMQTDTKTAELIKYMENCWNMMKVTFCNEFYEIAEVFDVSYPELREGFLLDERTERMHTAVFSDKRGCYTKCIPKDVFGIIEATKKKGYNPELLREIIKSNEKFRKKNER